MPRSWWVFVLAAFSACGVAIPALLSALGITTPWAVAAGAVTAPVAAFGAGMWQRRVDAIVTRRDEHALARHAGCLTLASGRLPKVRELSDLRDWGVHPAAQSEAEGPDRPPAYVPRDIDDEVRARIVQSGFILLVGDSTAGKTRCAVEAVTAMLPGHTLIVPTRTGTASALAAAGQHRRCVLWLNDLDTYMGDPELTRGAIARLITEAGRTHRVIIATLRATEENRLRTVPEDATARLAHRAASEILDRAHTLRLPRLFTRTERERARDRSWDARIADALAHGDEYGIAEYLANGPQLLAEWENAWAANTDVHAPSHPCGAALIASAVEVRRCGYLSAIPRRLLTEVHGHYLEQHGGARLDPEPLDDAWQWATRSRRGTTRLLEPKGSDTVSVFDYLTDTAQKRTPPGDHVPDHVVGAALRYAGAEDAMSIGSAVNREGRYRLAESAYRRAHADNTRDLGLEDPRTLKSRSDLAAVLTRLGRSTEAEPEHRAVLEVHRRVLGTEHPTTLASRNNLATTLADLRRFQEAERELREIAHVCGRVLGTHHPSTLTSRNNHATTLARLGRLAEAEREHRAVLEMRCKVLGVDHPDTLASLDNHALLLARMRRDDGAEKSNEGDPGRSER